MRRRRLLRPAIAFPLLTGVAGLAWHLLEMPEDLDVKATRFPAWAGAIVRLPTEAEWEYACRAGSRGRWTRGNECRAPNDRGLLGFHGGLPEWCADTGADFAGGEP